MDLSTAQWRKSSHSGDNQGNCVELANVPGTVAIRDSKDPEGGNILVGRQDFVRFARVIKGL
ncbi:DUF397 domain-containing protein [Spirillospora sp. NPDC050679]